MGGGSSTPTGEDPSEFDDKTSQSAGIPTGTNSTDASSTSQSSGNPGSVTPGDQEELEAHAGDLSDTVNIRSPTTGPSPGEFARQAFADGVQARRIEAGFDGHAAAPINSNTTVIGGWNSFETRDITAREPLKDAVDAGGGRTADHMEEVALASRSDRAANTAYATNYDHESNFQHAPRRENAHSQMAVYASLDAMGVRAPRHAFDTETKTVYVESVQRPGYDTELAEPGELSTEYANRIDPDQMKDVMAANLIVGNGDIKSDNLMVGEDGRVTPFDFDFTDTAGTLASVQVEYDKWISDAIESVNAARDEPLGFDTSEVVDRVEELATQLDESGAVDRVVEAAAEYDDFFQNESKDDYGGWETNNLDRVSDRVKKHVTNWSNASNETIT